MNLNFAVDRLYESGWLPDEEMSLERLPGNGLRYPTVATVQREFAAAGLDLVIKPNLMFKCCRATWHPTGEPKAENQLSDDRHGTVVGNCDAEAAVYALAKLRATTTAATRMSMAANAW